ncbi:MAG: hypothetical protein A3B66_00465 [Alphaproteobacteria bacterium RIFCSPHIGHO2_02_FULL_46_13]|nr:MAG: hypothetical protein A3B66_00465 [Alphaproteobacteria bacterium RIFCSPHIGHO2_02_FULL_46_13]
MKYLVLLLLVISSFHAVADDLDDGTYDAIVTTDSGSYTVPVEVENGEVTHVEWPNGGNMSVRGADLYDGSASGYNSRGDSIEIEIDQ